MKKESQDESVAHLLPNGERKGGDATKGRIDFKGMWNAMSDQATVSQPAQAAQVDGDAPCAKCGSVSVDTGFECNDCGHDNAPTAEPAAQAELTARPCQEAAERAISNFLSDELGQVPSFTLAEDGEPSDGEKCGWSFWVTEDGCEGDTTSYVHADLSIEWYGTSWEAPTAEPMVQLSPLAAFVRSPVAERARIGQQVAARVDEMLAEPVAQVARPCREAAERSVGDFLKEKLGEVPAFQLAEDGVENWSFWVTEDGCDGDTTSYVHADLSIEWYGTAWGAPTSEPVAQGEALVCALCEKTTPHHHLRGTQPHASPEQPAGRQGEAAPFGYLSRDVTPFRSTTPHWHFTHHRVDPHGCIEAMPVYTHPAH